MSRRRLQPWSSRSGRRYPTGTELLPLYARGVTFAVIDWSPPDEYGWSPKRDADLSFGVGYDDGGKPVSPSDYGSLGPSGSSGRAESNRRDWTALGVGSRQR